ncbi:MAG: peptide-methionine (S)-S-oxide reductase MsrA [Elusimicrobiales bacterium]|nr:peptide-methionine (S)-S-oxide reductase MsrA [Elusimicrobiales bacterium]
MARKICDLGGGCFWGVEFLMAKLKGVINTKVGYSGGHLENPSYEEVKKGNSGHAESVWIEFDDDVIKLKDIYDYFFVIHDPTTPNRQMNDIGHQYRSVIFYLDDEQKEIALKAIEDAQKKWKKKIVTEIVKFEKFWDAEEYHQKYLWKNPGGYICHFERKF